MTGGQTYIVTDGCLSLCEVIRETPEGVLVNVYEDESRRYYVRRHGLFLFDGTSCVVKSLSWLLPTFIAMNIYNAIEFAYGKIRIHHRS